MALLTYDEMTVGEHFQPLEYDLTPGLVRTFRDVVGDRNPIYDRPQPDGALLVPPMAFAFDWHRVPNRNGNTQGGLHAKQTFRFTNPARVGSRVRMDAWLADKYERRGYRYTTVAARIQDQEGRLVAEGASTVASMAERGFHPKPPRGTLDPTAVPQPGLLDPPILTRTLVEADMARYWHAVCGHPEEGSHSSIALARQQGLPTAIGQGNMVLCILGALLGDYFGARWYHGGAMDVRIVGRMLEGDTVTWRAVRRSAPADTSTVALDVWCTNQDGKLTIVGSATAPKES